MKKAVCLGLAAALACGCLLAGCGKEATKPAPTDTSFQGAVSAVTYESAEAAVKGFLFEEVGGDGVEFVSYAEGKTLSKEEEAALALGTASEGLTSVTQGTVTYREVGAEETLTRSVYVLHYADSFRFFTPAAIAVGESITKSYFESLFALENFRTCEMVFEQRVNKQDYLNGSSEEKHKNESIVTEKILFAVDGTNYREMRLREDEYGDTFNGDLDDELFDSGISHEGTNYDNYYVLKGTSACVIERYTDEERAPLQEVLAGDALQEGNYYLTRTNVIDINGPLELDEEMIQAYAELGIDITKLDPVKDGFPVEFLRFFKSTLRGEFPLAFLDWNELPAFLRNCKATETGFRYTFTAPYWSEAITVDFTVENGHLTRIHTETTDTDFYGVTYLADAKTMTLTYGKKLTLPQEVQKLLSAI